MALLLVDSVPFIKEMNIQNILQSEVMHHAGNLIASRVLIVEF